MPPMTVKKQYLAIKGHNSSPKAQLCYLDTSLKECYQRIKRGKKTGKQSFYHRLDCLITWLHHEQK